MHAFRVPSIFARRLAALSHSGVAATHAARTRFAVAAPQLLNRWTATQTEAAAAEATREASTSASVRGKPQSESEEGEIVHDMVHFKTTAGSHPFGLEKTDIHSEKTWLNPMQHSVWSEDEVNNVPKTHREPQSTSDRAALRAVKAARWMFDTISGYRFGEITEGKVLRRAIFLETVAGVPGMTAGMLRHLRSLRRMDRDHGWIHTLLEEAENERMHLLTFIKLRKPGALFRSTVVLAQGIFMNMFFLTYLASPRTCHRFVGYLEEEAVKTYTQIIDAIDDGRLGQWQTQPAPKIAINYWHLREDATIRDLMLVVRADEAHHRDVNHTLSDLDPDQLNPYRHEAPAETPAQPTA